MFFLYNFFRKLKVALFILTFLFLFFEKCYFDVVCVCCYCIEAYYTENDKP